MKAKPKKGIPLHMHIALGGSPKTFKGAVANAVVRPKKK